MEKMVSNFDDYIINDSGENEKSVWSIKTQQWLKPRPMPNGYVQICFTKEGKHHNRYLHRLLAEAFINNPDNKPTVNHKNHIRNDNRLENLEWATHLEQNDVIMRRNCSRARMGQRNSPSTEFKKGMTPWNMGIPHTEETKAKISDANSKPVYQYNKDGELIKKWDKTSDIGEQFSKDCIQKCCDGKQKQHKGYIWRRTPL